MANAVRLTMIVGICAIAGCLPKSQENRALELQSGTLTGGDFILKPGEVALTFDDGPSTFTRGWPAF